MGSAFRSLVLNARRSTWMSTASSAPWRRPVASPTCAARCGQARGTERWRCAHGFECTRHGFVKGTMCSRFARWPNGLTSLDVFGSFSHCYTDGADQKDSKSTVRLLSESATGSFLVLTSFEFGMLSYLTTSSRATRANDESCYGSKTRKLRYIALFRKSYRSQKSPKKDIQMKHQANL